MKFFYKFLMFLIIYGLLAIPDNTHSIHPPTGNQLHSSGKWWGKYAQNLVKFRITNATYQDYKYNEHHALLTKHLNNLVYELVDANDPILDSIRFHINKLSALVSLKPNKLGEFAHHITIWRSLLKYQSRYWDVSSADIAHRLFILYSESHFALESAVIQTEAETLTLTSGKPKNRPHLFRLDSLYFKSGDVVLFNVSEDSPLVPTTKEMPNSFKHMASIYINDGKALAVFMDHSKGLIAQPLKKFVAQTAPHGAIYRVRNDLPDVLNNPLLAEQVATSLANMAEKGRYKYDFKYNQESNIYLYDWELLSKAFNKQGFKLNGTRLFSNISDLSLGVNTPHSIPFELEFDHRFNFVGEWINGTHLYQKRINTAALTSLVHTKNNQYFINPFMLPLYRLKKAYSMVVGVLGGHPPIAKGISAQTQMVLDHLQIGNETLKNKLTTSLAAYEQKRGHKSTYLKMLQKSDELAGVRAANY